VNVYSLRLIPNLKLKLCEFLGIASSYAIEELCNRVGSLERRMTQFDLRAKRGGNLTFDPSLKILKAIQEKPKKKKAAVSPASAKKRKAKAAKPAVAEASPVVAAIEPVALPEIAVEAAPEIQKDAVILIKQDDATAEAVRAHYSERAEILRCSELAEIASCLEGRNILAIFFDRTLLGDAVSREILELIAGEFPETAMVGLSSYLTLAVSEAVPQNNEWAYFLTKPLSSDHLGELLGNLGERAIS